MPKQAHTYRATAPKGRFFTVTRHVPSTRLHYFDDLPVPNAVSTLTGQSDAEICQSLSAWTRAELLSPEYSKSATEKEDATKKVSTTDVYITSSTVVTVVLSNLTPKPYPTPPNLTLLQPPIDYYILRSTSPLTLLSQIFSLLPTLSAPPRVSMLALSHPYTYEEFSLVDKCLDFMLPNVPVLGEEVCVTHHHPQFKDAPRLLYVGRHSPVPVFVVTGRGREVRETRWWWRWARSGRGKKQCEYPETPF